MEFCTLQRIAVYVEAARGMEFVLREKRYVGDVNGALV
jgi:hypothetical protein